MNKVDVLSRLTPQMTAVLAQEDELAGDANDTSVGFEQMRLNYVAGRSYWTQGGPTPVKIIEGAIPGAHGDIAVRYYYPTEQATAPAILYIHGGGFVLGNPDTHDRITRILAEKTKAVVVSIDYRLSPEAQFPSAVEECATVARYLHENGSVLGIDGDRLSFAGDSGGAHLSLATTMYLREEYSDISYIKCLLLFYGWFGLADSMSMRLFGGSWDGLTESDWQFYLAQYAKDPVALMQNPYANCFLNDLTRDVPPCYIAAAEFDPLLDDSTTLARIFEEYGIPFRYEIFKGVIHAFLHYTLMLDAANEALEQGAEFYRQQLG